MYGRELRLPDQLMHGSAAEDPRAEAPVIRKPKRIKQMMGRPQHVKKSDATILRKLEEQRKGQQLLNDRKYQIERQITQKTTGSAP